MILKLQNKQNLNQHPSRVLLFAIVSQSYGEKDTALKSKKIIIVKECGGKEENLVRPPDKIITASRKQSNVQQTLSVHILPYAPTINY